MEENKEQPTNTDPSKLLPSEPPTDDKLLNVVIVDFNNRKIPLGVRSLEVFLTISSDDTVRDGNGTERIFG